jgi:hypothetical protein
VTPHAARSRASLQRNLTGKVCPRLTQTPGPVVAPDLPDEGVEPLRSVSPAVGLPECFVDAPHRERAGLTLDSIRSEWRGKPSPIEICLKIQLALEHPLIRDRLSTPFAR